MEHAQPIDIDSVLNEIAENLTIDLQFLGLIF